MLKSLRAYTRKHYLLRPGDRLGLAVSGGADSVALLRAMLELRSDLGVVLSVVHLHHGIRGPEADADETFVASLATQHDLPFHCDRADVPRFAKEHSLSLEAAARKLRYHFFERLLNEKTLDSIATAHTRDDQAETVLLRFLRGAGTRGLAGIHPVLNLAAGKIIRPMLDVSRSGVVVYLESLNQPWREDATNSDTKHTRNRIRHELLPLLERDYNPNLRQLLTEVADSARDEEEFWTGLIFDSQQAIRTDEKGTWLLIDSGPRAVRRRLLRLAAQRAGLTLDFHHVEQLLALTDRAISGEVELPGGFCARLGTHQGTPGLVIYRDQGSPDPNTYDLPLTIPSETPIPLLRTLVRVTKVRYTADTERYNPASLLDAALLSEPLRLRNWRHGDRYRPLHRGSEEKLKRLFQEKHVPADQRGYWPVITSGDKLVWVKNFPVAADFAAREGTSEAVLIESVEL